MPAVLNDLEQRILDYMVRYLRTRTYQPSIREIGEEFGIKSTKTVSEHLKALARKGYLERDPSRSRGVRILGVDLNPDTVSVPCYAGLPHPDARRRTDGIETTFSLDRRIAGARGCFFVRTRGDEFAALGIGSGDLLLVEPADALPDSDEALRADGALVMVANGSGAELYRCSHAAGETILIPAGGGEPIRVEDGVRLRVTGRVVAIHRRLDGAPLPRSATTH
ncbi:MAG: hypothetical protein EA422_06125 [Gemmatimonadales bacterium]|nr:MAG: hypothetical protein EA422_06125 [Gemmatimonadales bacterium]